MAPVLEALLGVWGPDGKQQRRKSSTFSLRCAERSMEGGGQHLKMDFLFRQHVKFSKVSDSLFILPRAPVLLTLC